MEYTDHLHARTNGVIRFKQSGLTGLFVHKHDLPALPNDKRAAKLLRLSIRVAFIPKLVKRWVQI